ncbi:hypothetical protein C8A00DRAFT_45623 [Chaetomidium leptoderma]|uniref:Uncharacterized protein n=1 Tax=Chaetomidium leptoderma TaxID=669021 RepID=A0AAN6VGM5_9PEZI|nr:hypothetical protein C8A00DRAFT_45623 [Chaetomidium leptoderma]
MDIIGADRGTQSAIDIVEKNVFFKPQAGRGWQSKPELPTASEILAESDFGGLPENPVHVPWSSKDEYLTAQYEILRREAIEGLRFSVRSFADQSRREPMDDDFTNIYTQVRVKEYVMSTIGPLVRVSFSTERSKYRIQWQQSKRLQPGKIVALSPKHDNFRKICKIATIAQRPYYDGLDQDPPLVDLLWANPEDAVLDPTLEMVMIESLHGYFESARHALVGLQHAAQTDSPLDKYLTGTYAKDNHPAFLKEDPVIDLSTLASRATPDDAEAVEDLRTYDIVNSDVPDLQNLTLLDESQLIGLTRIISKELAIVQGPPGTGKTYTSVEAIKAMVANRRKHRGPPILVAAQTNHALDQILVHCIRPGANILRMGGRTQNEEIKPFTLFELRKKCQLPADSKCRFIDQRRRENIRKIQELIDALFSGRLLDPAALLDFGIITEAQHQSLCDESMEVHAGMECHGPFALWLGNSLIPAKIREDRHPTHPELSEAEARKNLPEFEFEDDEEIENIADDEEDLYRFRGQVITLKHVWSGKDPANLTSWDRAVRRALRSDDLFTIDRDLRGAVYQYFQARLLEAMAPRFAVLLAENIDLCKKRKASKFLGNAQLVDKQRIDIVGCTTTGLSKYRGCLAAMQPQSLLIEEAAETREANIVSALYPSVQQLILVGDHKQLAPKCDIQRLGEPPFNLNVSLFQRMVNLNMPFVMLKQQRRMKPELRYILNPFYPELFDHPSVESINNRPDVLGMGGRNSWLFDHTWPEDVNSDFSKFNDQEAEMVTNFFAYLVANGTPAEKITVLTFYKGQRKVLLGKLRRHPSIMGSAFNVCTVDSYQGEENDVILLSLVRSPQLDRSYAVGFLEDERRAVVAISRARRGFYVFGNVDNVLGAHMNSYNLWFRICRGFAEQGRVERERGLPIVCQPHQRESWIKELDDWGDNSGGCNLPCNQKRHCGHPCTLKCHAIAHEDLPCGAPCREILVCGHGCQKLCGQKCYCDCKAFEEVARQTQAAGQHMSLEQKIMQMGAEPTEMLMASLNNRNPSRQQGRQPVLPVPQAQHPQRQPAGPRVTQTAAQWGQFVENIDQHDEQLRQEHLATVGQPVSEAVIREVYQPTTLADGRRVQLTYSQIATAAASTSDEAGPIPNLHSGMADLSLTNGSSHAQTRLSSANTSAPLVGGDPPPIKTACNRPNNSQPNHRRGAKGARKSPAKTSSMAKTAPLQQPAPIAPPTSNESRAGSDLLVDAPLLVDTTTSDVVNRQQPEQQQHIGPLSGGDEEEDTSHLLAQIDPLVPVPSGIPPPPPPPSGISVPDTAANGVQAASAPAPSQGSEGQNQKNGGDEEEWLIEL